MAAVATLALAGSYLLRGAKKGREPMMEEGAERNILHLTGLLPNSFATQYSELSEPF